MDLTVWHAVGAVALTGVTFWATAKSLVKGRDQELKAAAVHEAKQDSAIRALQEAQVRDRADFMERLDRGRDRFNSVDETLKESVKEQKEFHREMTERLARIEEQLKRNRGDR